MPRRITKSDCVGCGTCERVCIVGAISEEKDRKRIIAESACVDCGACEFTCPKKCISQK